MNEACFSLAVTDEDNVSAESGRIDTCKEGFGSTAGLNADIKAVAVCEFLCEFFKALCLCVYI